MSYYLSARLGCCDYRGLNRVTGRRIRSHPMGGTEGAATHTESRKFLTAGNSAPDQRAACMVWWGTRLSCAEHEGYHSVAAQTPPPERDLARARVSG
jgi:hypothetical protein